MILKLKGKTLNGKIAIIKKKYKNRKRLEKNIQIPQNKIYRNYSNKFYTLSNNKYNSCFRQII